MKYALCSKYLPDIYTDILKDNGLCPVKLPCYDKMPTPVISHPDMLCFVKDDILYTYEDYYRNNSDFFDSLGIVTITTEDIAAPEYPHDIAMNCFGYGGILYGNIKYLSKTIRALYGSFSDCKQGYCACSTLIAGNCAVTADEGICTALKRNWIDVLEINPGGISLKGYDCGFIGGASAYLNNGSVLFFGKITEHPDGSRIREFLNSHGVHMIETDDRLSDYGGIKIISNKN